MSAMSSDTESAMASWEKNTALPKWSAFQTALRYSRRRRLRNVALAVLCVSLLGLWWSDTPLQHQLLRDQSVVSCVGPRGRRIRDSPDDQLIVHDLGPNPQTPVGSYDLLGLPPAWMTADERYGPYGYKQGEGNSRTPVQWDTVDWGQLQAQCQLDNAHRFGDDWGGPFNASVQRLRLRRPGDRSSDAYWPPAMQPQPFPDAPAHARAPTNRTLLVWRTYDGYTYQEEDKINLRALIAEAALQSGGEFSVMLLVNVKDPAKRIYESRGAYERAFRDANIPPEFQNITVLWDEQLLQSWYGKVDDHGLVNQVVQAVQLVGVFYPEYDHVWLLEPDMRSHGSFLTFLQALDRYSRNEPRKQALERASWFYIAEEHGSYHDSLVPKINRSAAGGSAVWGPLRVPEVPLPIGPTPPGPPEADNFEWGVGEPADLVSTGPCTFAFRSTWFFRDWYRGFSQGDELPRVFCPPAIQRASRALMRVVHAAQMDQGLALPSEATLPSFALFHGLKLSAPPQPVHQKRPPASSRVANVYWNGGDPGECLRVAEMSSDATNITTYVRQDDPPRDIYKGSACGDGLLNGFDRLEWQTSLSWSFMSDFTKQVLSTWRQDDIDEDHALTEEEEETLVVLKKHEGKWYAPAGWWHPIKTNKSLQEK